MHEKTRAHSLARRLALLDGRVKIPAALALGLALWTLPWPGVIALALGLFGLALALRAAGWISGASLLAVPLFGLGWGVTAFALKLLDGLTPATASAAASALLALRLAALMGLGLILGRTSSPVQMGRAAAWYLRPLGRRRAADIGLSLAMMLRFIPITWEAFQQIRTAFNLRQPHASWLKRQTLLTQTLLRTLGQRTWHMTLALASRKAWPGC